ncbi:MAG TPA: RNA polymerase sigma-54 factor, partial [Thermoanaerobaculia bacterium]|nr:RNA polymerase sigma-54 factor [Thermoanaerobaculia bacterium]
MRPIAGGDMALEQKLHLRLSQRLVMTPSLQQAIKLLQMSKLELEEVLTQEMVDNPILEEEQEEAATEAEAAAEAETGETPELPKAAALEAPGSPAEKERDSFDEIDFDSYFEEYLDTSYNPRQYEETEQIPLENILSRPPGLQEHLSWQISMSDATPEMREIATYLIGNIDEDGYLRVTREEIRAAGYDNEEDVEKALFLVRSF